MWAAEAVEAAQQGAAATGLSEEQEEEYEEHPIEAQACMGVEGMFGNSWQHWEPKDLLALINACALMCM